MILQKKIDFFYYYTIHLFLVIKEKSQMAFTGKEFPDIDEINDGLEENGEDSDVILVDVDDYDSIDNKDVNDYIPKCFNELLLQYEIVWRDEIE
jgi:hypothetical protein